MKKNILSVLVITFTIVVYTSCEKEEEESNNVVTPVECKTCGTFITFDDTVTDEEIAQYEAAGIVDATEEYCGNELSAFEADMEANGGEFTMDYPNYTLFGGCQ
jgi:hypothetical protein